MYLHQRFQLYQLIQTGFLSIIQQQNLLNQNNINSPLYQNRTPLHIAIISNQPQISQFLFKLNPKLDSKDSLGFTALDWLLLKKQNKCFQNLLTNKLILEKQLKKEQLKTKNININIWRAAQISLSELQVFFTRDNKQITQINKNPFIKDQLSRKAIHYAAISGNQQTFKYLIQHKFDPLQQDIFGFNCYHYINSNPSNPLNQIPNKIYTNLNFQIKQNHYDTIIIGSGAAGIGAGVTLSRNGLNYLVLQARDRIGGRILSENISDIELDLGACWVHSYSKNNPICKQVNQLKWKPRKSQNRSDSSFTSQLKSNLSQQQIHSALAVSRSYYAVVQRTAMDSDKDMSIEDAGKQYYEKFISNLAPYKKALVDMFINMSQHYNAASIKQLSAKYFQEQQDVGSDFCPDGSYYKLLNAIARSVNLNKKVHFNTVVKQINYFNKENDQYPCQIITENGIKYYSQKIISSLPLGILKQNKVKFNPNLAEIHIQCINKLGWGVMNKVIVSFDKPFWKQNPCWLRIACQQKGKFPAIYNFSTQNKHILCCFVTDNFAKEISSQSDQEIIESFISLLRTAFKKEQIKVLDYKITKWDKQPYSLGSYTHFGVETNMETTRKLRKNIDQKLWIVGEHCYGEHIGCAHGAFQTGIWAAQQILTCFKRIDKFLD